MTLDAEAKKTDLCRYPEREIGHTSWLPGILPVSVSEAAEAVKGRLTAFPWFHGSMDGRPADGSSLARLNSISSQGYGRPVPAPLRFRSQPAWTLTARAELAKGKAEAGETNVAE
jgi:hypothetical protein